MKKLIACMLVCLLTSSTFAQIRRVVPKDSSGKMHARMEKKSERRKQLAQLNLSREQKGKLKEMNKSGKAERNAIDNDESLTTEQKIEKQKSLRREKQQRLNEILSPEQKEKYKSIPKGKKGRAAP